MTPCSRWSEDLKAYADGELPPVTRLLVGLHLSRCALCREEVAEMEVLGSELRAGGPAEMPADLRERILSAAPEAGADEPHAVPGRLQLWRRPMVWFGAVATLVIGSVVYNNVVAPMTGGALNRRMAGGPMSADMATMQAKSVAPGAGRSASMVAEGIMGGRRAFGGAGTGGAGAMAAAPEPSTERYVARSASISVTVSDIETRSDEVEAMTRKSGGFVGGSNLSTGDTGMRTSSLTLRVPVNEFDSVLGRIAKLGVVTNKSVSGEDITEQVSDEQQAVRVLTAEIADLDSRMRQSGQNWSDLSASREARIRKAQTEARLDLLKKQARLSTIDVKLDERTKTQVHGGFLEDMGDAGRSAMNGFLTAVRVPMVVVIWVLAYAPVWVPLAFAYRWARRVAKQQAAARELRNWRGGHAPEV